MAFGRLERTARPTPMSDINMTPLVDVMLVLLVIFMLTAPLMSASLKLDLPRTEGATQTDVPDFIAVGLDARGQLHVDDKPISAPAFVELVKKTARRNPQTEVQLRADKTVPYGRVAELIGTVQDGGLSRVGFVVEAPAAGTAPGAAPGGAPGQAPAAVPTPPKSPSPAPAAAPTPLAAPATPPR